MNKLVTLTTLDIAVLVGYVMLLVGIGMFVSYRRRNEDDQFLAGRSFGWFNVGLSIFGTNISPSFLIASASAAYATGMVTANFEWLAWPFLMLLAMLFAPHYLKMKIGTMPQFVRRRFGQGPANFLSFYALLSTVVLWLGGALYAGGKLLSQILDWPLAGSVFALICVATFLTVAGGLAVVMVTDSFQSILMLAGAGLLSVLALHEAGGLSAVMETVPPDRWTLLRPLSDPDYPWHAMLLGYPVLGVWFWCTDQTIVQRVLGARSLKQGQLGAQFAGFLKILTPLVFTIPGFVCFVLHPELADPDAAFMTMVSTYMPAGVVGLIVAVLIAALISTVDSGLNSFSTIYTLDIHKRWIKPGATPHELKIIGRMVTVVIAALSMGIALSMDKSEKNLFDLLQSIIAYFAPPMSAVFLVGILWKKATARAAMVTLCGGSALSLGVGLLDFFKQPLAGVIGVELVLPHFLLTSFMLFAVLCLVMIFVSRFTSHSVEEQALGSLKDAYHEHRRGARAVWLGWVILAAIMLGIYLVFNLMPGWMD